MGNHFQFASLDYLEVATFDNSLEHFHRNGIKGTIKENLQNALDARLKENEPVKVIIRMHEVDKSILPGIDEIFEHINSLEGHNNYTIETINYMKSKIDNKTVPILSFEDSNSKGLTGAKNGQSNSKQDTYGIYAYNKGVHFVEDDSSKEVKRGGSHGIGKIANNAASDIHLMYFANCDNENNQHLGGTIQLIEHKLNNKNYRSTGYYSDVSSKTGKLIPFENKVNHTAFEKKSRGLKIIIPYVRKEFFKFNEIITSVCDNFFLAIIENNLIVEVYDIDDEKTIISSESIYDLVNDKRFYKTEYSDMKKIFTPLYVDTLRNSLPINFEVSNNTDTYKFKLYFVYNPEIIVGRVAIFRTIGMKIEDFGVQNNKRKPFNAVLVGGIKEDQYLKSLENESHTQLSYEDIRDEYEKKNAKKFMINLHKELSKIIEENFNKNNPTDGKLDTDDLIYETEVSFKNILENNTEKVTIRGGKTVLKSNVKEKRDKKGGSSNKSTGENKKERKPRKVKNDNNLATEQYITPTDAVSRINIEQDEIISIDLKKIGLQESEIKRWNTCNLIFKIVDGNGDVVKDQLDFLKYVVRISDLVTNNTYNYDKNKVKNIKMLDHQIKIRLTLKNTTLSRLKFTYEVEVKK
ncbi:hypothetical protein [Macrococcus capreoli]|uniref:hypothetical protein n=1 Tax=Macrococcus capreoli TaxID=2982690 RepID=UPI0021D5F41E|nr:hypothetical protein [Macrococcus sp. TMW 2.2395]MCU7558429.1 hypothetical protein [Macrococcus sp. TMW 2.2395]